MNLNNPFTKLKADDLYIVYPVTYSYTRTKDTRSASYHDYDLLTHLIRTATVDNNPILMVVNPEAKEKYVYAYPSTVYGNNIETGEVIHFDSNQVAMSINDTTEREIAGKVKNEDFYSFPTKLKDVFDLNDTISVRKALNLLHELQKMRGKRESITLDSNPLIAAEQLEEGRVINHSILSDKDMKSVLEQLKEVSGSQSEVFNKYIISKVTAELEQYRKNMKDYKPTFEKIEKTKSGDFQLGENKPKDQLMLNLNILYHSLLSDVKTVHYLDDLYTCSSIVDGNDKELTKNTPLAKKVQDIVSNVSSFDNKAEILSDLKARIDAEIDKTSASLDETISKKEDKQEINLVLDDPDSFKKEISMLATTYGEKSKVLSPFYELKNSLNNIGNNSKGDINEFLSSVSELITKISNEQLRESTQEKYNQIKANYISKVDAILSNQKDIKPDDYRNLEIELRKELQPFLREVNKIGNKNLNQIYTSESLLIQIRNSIKLINSRKNPDTSSHSKEPITSKVGDVLDLLKKVSLEDEREIINKLLIKLISYKEKLIDTEISGYKEYDEVRTNILKSISSLEVDTYSLINKQNDYDKQNIDK